jgi:hypothetical protein
LDEIAKRAQERFKFLEWELVQAEPMITDSQEEAHSKENYSENDKFDESTLVNQGFTVLLKFIRFYQHAPELIFNDSTFIDLLSICKYKFKFKSFTFSRFAFK